MSVMEEKEPRRRTRRSFSPEFKRDAVALVLDEGRTIADVARSLGIGETNLGNWVRQARIDRGGNGRGSRCRRRPSWLSCAVRTRGCGWNETCSNERRPFG